MLSKLLRTVSETPANFVVSYRAVGYQSFNEMPPTCYWPFHKISTACYWPFDKMPQNIGWLAAAGSVGAFRLGARFLEFDAMTILF